MYPIERIGRREPIGKGADMIHDHPEFGDQWSRSDFEQLRRFLGSRHADGSAYRLAHEAGLADGDGDAGAVVSATYGSARFRNGNSIATISWSTPSGATRVRTDLQEAMFILAFAFDRPDNLALLTDLPSDTDARSAVETLALEPGVLVKRVAALDAGSYVAPDAKGAGWSLFLVETYGEVVILADSAQPAPLLQMLVASQRRQAQNLAGRMAEFLVPEPAAQ